MTDMFLLSRPNLRRAQHAPLCRLLSVGGISISPSLEPFIISHLFCRTSRCLCVCLCELTHWVRQCWQTEGWAVLPFPACHSLHRPISLSHIAARGFLIVLFSRLFQDFPVVHAMRACVFIFFRLVFIIQEVLCRQPNYPQTSPPLQNTRTR